jgi:hypothetical protein
VLALRHEHPTWGPKKQNPCGEFINTTNFTANGASVEILIRCKCGIKYKIESRNAGKKGKCGACHATFMIPTQRQREVVPSPAPGRTPWSQENTYS